MRKPVKSLLALALVAVLSLGSLTGCGNAKPTANEAAPAAETQKEVVLSIPYYKTGANVGAKFFLPQVERFNTAYAGKYKLVIEEVPNDEYRDKIQLLQQQGKLPPLVENGHKEFMNNIIIKNDLFYDLKPWLDSKPELKKLSVESSIKFNTRNGKIVSMPVTVIRPIGLYYNKEMFQKAGITKPVSQMTFEEFDKALADIKTAGNKPLALMTSENAWTSMLLASAIFASQPGGTEILEKQEVVTDYTGDAWVNTFAVLQKYLHDYTTDNAIGAAYADAANNFLNERTAIIANGPWMVGDFSDTSKAAAGFDKKVAADIYPKGTALAGNEFYWWIPKGLDPKVTEGALAFLEFINKPEELEAYMVAEGGVAPNLKTTDAFNSKLNPILLELNNSVSQNMKSQVPTFEQIMPAQIFQNEFGKLLPKLADGSMTPKQFAEDLTKKAQQFK